MTEMPPKTIEEAVQRLLTWKWAKDPSQVDHVRGMKDDDLPLLHFSMGMSIRNEFGFYDGNADLLSACSASDPDDASAVILRALRDHLVRTATPEEMQRAAANREARVAERLRARQEEAMKDAAITDRRCTHCGFPCPRYRKTCKVCGFEMGRE